ncbi:hypothetical protein GCM10023264_22450 [Sphingomonas daechungensis]|uniref:DUF3052 family protein n=1 Tax=Sphingomonas daechungensis TaxID=1176646 RepID=A0ABX6T1H4_9SPHN|nr:DUF3052 family protein [Sphingomonas daechungensis]QNP43682.1 DUF3052 family protein [Sphingomonas daechungensis]
MTAGYSGTPLGKKLGYRQGMRVFVGDMPDPIRHEIEQSIGEKPEWQFIPESELEAAHVFVTQRTALEDKARALLPLLGKGGFLWVSWPKKAAKVATDITEDTIREVCLPMGLVDVKVCAIDATWSGLKLMRRR